MTLDDVATINGKVDNLASEVASQRTAIEVLIAEFKAHRAFDQESVKNREATCPQNQIINRLVNDVDALAGVQRSNTARLGKLEEWHHAEKDDELIHDAKSTVIYAPLRWLWSNGTQIAVALIIAYMIWRFGF